MKNIISIILLIISFKTADAQKLDSLYFNLYTDSLKKGTFNYINVDGRYSDGRYLPLTTKELIFSCDAGIFEGNSLYLDTSLKLEKVIVKVSLKSDPAVTRERTIFIKKFEDSSGVKTMEEVMQPKRKKTLKEI